MIGLRIYILFNSILVISGQWMDDNERLMLPHLWLEKTPASGRAQTRNGTARWVGQRLICWVTGAPKVQYVPNYFFPLLYITQYRYDLYTHMMNETSIYT